MKCFYCGTPIDFMELNIDHVIPQALRDNPAQLEAVLREYGIIENFPGFAIDGLSNLVPSHGASCNLRKSSTLLPKPAALFYLTLVNEKLLRVAKELERLTDTAERGAILGTLGIQLEVGNISEREVIDLLDNWKFRHVGEDPLVITFGLNFDNAIEMRGMAATESARYATFCDQLESELMVFLRTTTIYSFHYAEASARNGETLSVRLVFPELELDELDNLPIERVEQLMPWWEVLEISSFILIYGDAYG